MLGRDPDLGRNVPTAPSLASKPKVREGTIGCRRAACKNNKVYLTSMARRVISKQLVCGFLSLSEWACYQCPTGFCFSLSNHICSDLDYALPPHHAVHESDKHLAWLLFMFKCL